MKEMSLPYIDQPSPFWYNLTSEFKDFVKEVYFPIREDIMPSGRPSQPNLYLYDFLEKIHLPKAVLINSMIIPQPIEKVKDLLINELFLLNQYYGIQRVTVKDLQLCELIRNELPFYKINASVLMGIQTSEQLIYLQNIADELTPDTAIIRDMLRLQQIRKLFPKTIKLIVNEGCLPHCPFRVQHFYEMGSGLTHPASLCQNLLKQYPWLRLKSAWILPQHLHFYDGLYDIIKLAGRVTLQNPEKYKKVLKAYCNQTEISANEIGTGPAGMTENLPITDEFFYQTITCDKNCCHCTFCKDYYEKYKVQSFIR